jgi:uncharacterized protein YqgV (UPF0045/DUF77 family)
MEARSEAAVCLEDAPMSHQVIAFDVGLRHFAYCIMDADVATRHRRVRALEVVDLGCKKNNVQKIIDAVIELMDEIVYNQLQPERPLIVLIESQMTAVMKCVQTVINAYFKITAKYSGTPVETHYMSAKHKLNLIRRYPDYADAEKAAAASSQYKQNKADSIQFARWLLQHKDEDVATLAKVDSFKKKDDLTDAYLMAVYHVEAVLWYRL